MQTEREIKRQVREFYNQVGWREISDGLYQNARYEDLRPVSQEYIHRCHKRISRHIAPSGRFLLDAGSGPIQYPEYLEYSKQYEKRVCADISHTALQAARRRIGQHGLFVVADVARLPFAGDLFDGVVSLHTVHHIPIDEHLQAYLDLHRVLAPGHSAAIVNGWDNSSMMAFFNRIKRLILRLRHGERKRRKGEFEHPAMAGDAEAPSTGTYVAKNDPAWLRKQLKGKVSFKVYVWRSAGTNFLRFFIREKWFGRRILRLLFWLEDRFPHFFGRVGRYPLLVLRKAA